MLHCNCLGVVTQANTHTIFRRDTAAVAHTEYKTSLRDAPLASNIVASQPGYEKVAWYRLFVHAYSISHIFLPLYPHNSMYGMIHNLEYGPVATHVVLMAITPDDLRLVTRSIISDTKGDTSTTTLLATAQQPHTETVVDVRKIPSVLLHSQKLGDILRMRKQSVPGHSFVARL